MDISIRLAISSILVVARSELTHGVMMENTRGISNVEKKNIE